MSNITQMANKNTLSSVMTTRRQNTKLRRLRNLVSSVQKSRTYAIYIHELSLNQNLFFVAILREKNITLFLSSFL